jgi:hypothetical protein
VVQQNVRLSEATVTEILDSNHLPITFSIVDHVRARGVLDPAENFTDWEQFQSVAFEIISRKIQTHFLKKVIKLHANLQLLSLRHMGCRLQKEISF